MVWIGLAAFIAVLAYVVVSSLAPREEKTFAPSPRSDVKPPRPDGADTLTIDTRDGDHWQFVDLDAGRWLPEGTSTGWDVAVRRFTLIAAVAAADAGVAAFDSLAPVTADRYIPNIVGRDTINPALDRWYSYSMMSHLLTPNGHVYLVRTSAGRVVKLQPLSYYCPEMSGGCLTFRYGLAEPAPAAP